MLENLLKRRDDEEGFTLIELMVVVLIIGILVAIAVPTFLNAQNNAKSKAAQSNARSALSAAKTVHADKETYDVAVGDLRTAEPSLDWQAEGALSSAVDDISWTADANSFVIAVRAKNNDCFYIRDIVDPANANRGTMYALDTAAVAAACQADDVSTLDTTWSTSQTGTAGQGWVPPAAA